MELKQFSSGGEAGFDEVEFFKTFGFRLCFGSF